MNPKLLEYLTSRPRRVSMRLAADLLEKANQEERVIPMTFGAPSYVERWYGILVLDFSSEAVMLERWKAGAPYFMDHNPGDQRGIILNGDLVDTVLRGDVKFSRNEEGVKLYNDVIDKIRPFTSMGFDILEIDEIAPDDMPDDLKTMCLELECPAYRVKRWRPYEGSSVPLGANPNVGVEYDYLDGNAPEEIFKLAESFGITRLPKKFVEHFGHKDAPAAGGAPRGTDPKPIIHQSTSKEATMPKTKEELEALVKERKAALMAFGSDYKDRIPGGEAAVEKLAADVATLFAEEEPEIGQNRFRGELFVRVTDKDRLETPASFVAMTDKEMQEYSFTRVLRHLVDGEELGIEKDIHQQIVKNGAKQQKTGSILIPFDMMSRKIDHNAELAALLAERGISMGGRRSERFDQTTTTTAGGYLVGTQHRPQDFVEIYRNLLIQGLTYLPGLQGNVDIPKQTGGSTITVAATEAAGFSETALVFGQLTLSPKEIGAYIEITRKLLVQSSPAIDNLVAIDLMRQMALKTNYLALYGSGASGEPTGAFLTDNIGTFEGTSLGRTGALDAMADIGSANVVGKLEWLMNAAMKALLMGRDQTSGFGKWLLDDSGMMVGFGHQVSEQMAANTLALAKLDEIIVAGFGNMEVLYDRNTNSTSGGLRIAAYDLIDAGVKHPGAISYASSVS